MIILNYNKQSVVTHCAQLSGEVISFEHRDGNTVSCLISGKFAFKVEHKITILTDAGELIREERKKDLYDRYNVELTKPLWAVTSLCGDGPKYIFDGMGNPIVAIPEGRPPVEDFIDLSLITRRKMVLLSRGVIQWRSLTQFEDKLPQNLTVDEKYNNTFWALRSQYDAHPEDHSLSHISVNLIEDLELKDLWDTSFPIMTDTIEKEIIKDIRRTTTDSLETAFQLEADKL